jgi:hypothetical protein
MIFYGKIKDLALKPDSQVAWLDFLEKNDGKKVMVEITDDKPKRSLDQNALYWVYLGVIEQETGNLATDLHELFKRKFLPPIPKKILGVDFKLPASTTELSKAEFGEYLDKISAFTEIAIPQQVQEFLIEVAYPVNNLKPLL